MKFELVYTKRAVDDINELDPIAKKRLGKKLLLLAENPLKYSKKLKNTDLGSYRYRIGDYRVVFDVDGRKIVVLRVGHRREIYR
ncbi:MAG: type II toxin-antitoxin system RelE/ParE family toxin [Deltaproteobacteria bacterium]|nr:type II toxin-antitoxin system RelE/ParE family toxin [Deltaproteobacteria bacterium]